MQWCNMNGLAFKKALYSVQDPDLEIRVCVCVWGGGGGGVRFSPPLNNFVTKHKFFIQSVQRGRGPRET